MVITLGAFDGFHTGHQRLFKTARRMAEVLRTDWGVVTFEPHPGIYMGKIKAVMFEQREREVLRRALGVPHLYNIKFDEKLRNLSAEEFLTRLNERIKIHGIVVGDNFRFGKNHEGGLDDLRHFCFTHNAGLGILNIDIYAMSSAKGRKRVAGGVTNKLLYELGYPWFIWTKVIKGNQRGRELGYPTANLDIADRALFPCEAVYAAAVPIFDDKAQDMSWHAACVSVGRNPTFKDVNELRAEVYITDFDGDLYNKDIQVFFLNKLRRVREFANQDELIEQIGLDVKRSRRFFDLAFKPDERRDIFMKFAAAIRDMNSENFKLQVISLDDK